MAWDDGTYGSHTTVDMIRVARLATPAHDTERWTLTADDRTWSYGFEMWNAVGAGLGLVTLTEEALRECMSEQLAAYGVGEASPLWWEH